MFALFIFGFFGKTGGQIVMVVYTLSSWKVITFFEKGKRCQPLLPAIC